MVKIKGWLLKQQVMATVVKEMRLCRQREYCFLFMMILVLQLILQPIRATSTGRADLQTMEVCNMETFSARCDPGKVIVMETAMYGRMRIGRCISAAFGNIGCTADVLRYLDGLCSGRSECSVKVPDDSFYNANTCPKDMMPYLETSYSCMSVLSGEALMASCRTERAIRLENVDEGTIASSVVYQSRAGSLLCPWLIEAKPGQKINVTLVDFGSPVTGESGEGPYTPTCHKYAILSERDESSTGPTTVCSARQRLRNIYLSKSHRLELQFTDISQDETNQPHFLLRFKVIGCPHPPSNGNQILERTSEKAILLCESTGQKTYVYCHGSAWNAEIPACKKEHGADGSFWRLLSEDWSSPKGIVITVGIGVALGTVIGLALLAFVLVCMKHRRKLAQRARGANQGVYYDEQGGGGIGGGGGGVLDENLCRKQWDSDLASEIGYNTCSRMGGPGNTTTAANKNTGHYGHVWNPDGTDLVRVDSVDFLRRNSERCGIPPGHGGQVGMGQGPLNMGLYQHTDHVYEKPT